jgi:hypothetical protein
MPITPAAIEAGLNLAILILADFVDEPIRAAFSPMPVTVPNLLSGGDADCWNQTFSCVDDRVLSISAPSHGAGGSEGVRLTIATDPVTGGELLTAIENEALYVGRKIRMWHAIVNNSGVAIHIQARGIAYMTSPSQTADRSSFIINMDAENYFAVFAGAQGRTYLNTKLWDAGDNAGAVGRGMAGQSAPVFVGGGGGMRYDQLVKEK